jgi:site-specific DNA-methyltransferase (adenine-specific)
MTTWEVRHGDCRDVMRSLPADSVDAIVSDPPYGLAFMGKEWDHGVPGVEFWTEALRVAKPGAHLVAFGGTRTFHRLAVAIEDAGWEIRDCLSWLYGSGFPKSLDVGKAIDKVNGETDRALRFCAWFRTTGVSRKTTTDAMIQDGHISANGTMAGHYYATSIAGQPAVPTRSIWQTLRPLCGDVPGWVDQLVERHEAEREVVEERTMIQGGGNALQIRAGERREVQADITRPATDAAKQWDGWGTALKPAWEPIVLARKPLIGTVAANVTAHGTGGINVDGCRIAGGPSVGGNASGASALGQSSGWNAHNNKATPIDREMAAGRWPANVCLDEDAAQLLDAQSGERGASGKASGPTMTGPSTSNSRGKFNGVSDSPFYGDTGGASRFFYTAKASRREREAGDVKNLHPTVKPIALMRWLCRLVTPPGGLVLDPFNGSGSTGCAAVLEGFRYLGAELDAEYVEIARKRIAHWAAQTSDPDLFG